MGCPIKECGVDVQVLYWADFQDLLMKQVFVQIIS